MQLCAPRDNPVYVFVHVLEYVLVLDADFYFEQVEKQSGIRSNLATIEKPTPNNVVRKYATNKYIYDIPKMAKECRFKATK